MNPSARSQKKTSSLSETLWSTKCQSIIFSRGLAWFPMTKATFNGCPCFASLAQSVMLPAFSQRLYNVGCARAKFSPTDGHPYSNRGKRVDLTLKERSPSGNPGSIAPSVLAPRRGALKIGRRLSFSAGILESGKIPVPEGRVSWVSQLADLTADIPAPRGTSATQELPESRGWFFSGKHG